METPKTKTSDDYKDAIKAYYEKIKNDIYSGSLLKPTPALLKQLCILKFESSCKIDQEIFSRFFAFKSEENKLRQIEIFDTDRFRPLCNFLKGKTKSIQHSSLEVIAILIDFKIRPLNIYLKSNYLENNRQFETQEKITEIDDMPINVISPIEEKAEKSITVKPKQYKQQIKTLLFATIYFVFISFLMSHITYPPEKEDNNKEYTMRIDCRFKTIENDSIYNPKTKVKYINKKLPLINREIKTDTTPFIYETGNNDYWYKKLGYEEINLIENPVMYHDTNTTLKIAQEIIESYVFKNNMLQYTNNEYKIVNVEVEIGVSYNGQPK